MVKIRGVKPYLGQLTPLEVIPAERIARQQRGLIMGLKSQKFYFRS